MSLYGALYAGVSGLQAQSNKLGIISDNIANVNTVGYKEGSATFETLVTNASGATAYSPGGVLSGNAQQVAQQGLLQTTTSPTDIAITGSGLFVVNQAADDSGQVLYTRAGSFTQDSNGDFVNTAGYFLQAWALDSNGLLPGEAGNVTNTTSSANLSSLQTVNVQNVTGTATPTRDISISANLNAGQTAALGAGATAGMDSSDATNFGINANELIAQTGVDSLTRNDSFTVSTSITNLNEKFAYGGFSIGRNITSGALTESNPGVLTALPTNTPIAINTAAGSVVSTGSGSHQVTIDVGNSGGYLEVGDVVTLAGLPDVGTITGADLTGRFVVTGTPDATHITVDALNPDTGGGSSVAGTGTIVERPYAGKILDASGPSQTFLGNTTTAGFLPAALTFTINTVATGTVTFTYTQSAPNALQGQFNDLTNLATAINDVTGLTARVINGNQLYVGPADANAAISFGNGADTGVSGPPVQAGIDWVNELGLLNQAANIPSTSQFNRFSTLQSLAGDVNSINGLTATVTNPTGASSLSINASDPLDTITFSDNPAGYGGVGDGVLNVGSPLAQLHLSDGVNPVASLGGNVPLSGDPVITLGPLGPAYAPDQPAKNMASGAIPAQFSRPVTVFDSLGSSHNLNVAFLKTGSNTWGVEIYSQPGSDVNNPSDGSIPSDGQVASGTLTFRGDGTLSGVTGGLTGKISINWTNGALPSAVTFNWGTDGKTDGFSQFDSGFNVNSVNQNGTPVGQLTGVAIDSNGFITASFNNGQTQKLYKIPLAEFTDPNQLQSVTGNAYTQTSGSGIVNLKQAGQSGVGSISSGSLEQSNVELANQLTDMIVAQRAYQANTKVIQTADSLLNDLDQIIQ